MEFFRKLKALAGRHRFSQDMLAKALGVSQGKVSLWTRGQNIPDLYEAAQLAELFHVDLNYLADDSLDEPPQAELTSEERALVSLIRAKGLAFDEVVRRLEAQPQAVVPHGPPPAYEHGTGRVVGARNETEGFARRNQDPNAPRPATPPTEVQGGKGGRQRGGKDRRGGSEGK